MKSKSDIIKRFALMQSLKGYRPADLPHDLIAGLVVAALTIPVAMGYAQIAGLPTEYGLYGSILPCIVYALFSSSPQMIFGMDAAAVAITGSIVASAGVAFGSTQALVMIPVLSFFTACILILFGLVGAGKIIGYISKPVMGGFVSGVAIAVVITQIPKMLGVTVPPSEELLENLQAILFALPNTNSIALLLGFGSLAILLVAKHFAPRFPTSLVVLVAGVIVTAALHLDNEGVVVLGHIDAGLPPLMLPNLTFENIGTTLGYSLSIAVVVTAESLLASNTFATHNHYRIDDNRELIAFGLGNLMCSFVGSAPSSTSVSRTAAADGAGERSQLTSLFAAGFIALVCLFLSPYLFYLPMPVLGAIVTAALLSLVEVKFAVRLYRHHRFEFIVFIVAAIGVLVFGVIFGVLVGVALSFFVLLVQADNPMRGELGILPDHSGFHLLSHHADAQRIPGVFLYDFNATLSFSNIRTFIHDLEAGVNEDTRLVIVDGSGINDVDVTSTDRLLEMVDDLNSRGIEFYVVVPESFEYSRLAETELAEALSVDHLGGTIGEILAAHDIDPRAAIEQAI